MADETYNGWKNRETWAAALWLSNDEMIYGVARGIVSSFERPGDELRAWVEAVASGDEDFVPLPDGMLRDIGSLWRVDWDAVADSLRDE